MCKRILALGCVEFREYVQGHSSTWVWRGQEYVYKILAPGCVEFREYVQVDLEPEYKKLREYIQGKSSTWV